MEGDEYKLSGSIWPTPYHGQCNKKCKIENKFYGDSLSCSGMCNPVRDPTIRNDNDIPDWFAQVSRVDRKESDIITVD